jgi:hypothetical protein
MALAVQLFLKMDRVDKAEQLAKVGGGSGWVMHDDCCIHIPAIVLDAAARTTTTAGRLCLLLMGLPRFLPYVVCLQQMSSVDDDATLTQLATAWVGVQLGGAKVQEAQYIYQELGDKFNYTVGVWVWMWKRGV